MREAYFITEFQAGISCRDYFRDTNIPVADRKNMAEKVSVLLQRFFNRQFTHGDLKASNVMICGDEAVLIDLDSMQAHTQKKAFEQGKEKDVKRFLKNWVGDEVTTGWFLTLAR